ncbi:hypothetical protein BGZ65_008576 [Modicella reniformis]|uniref:Major facilitator superfamily (MFS) profile domain-containing protein n=1 Tax=Modicella reniformis TaxID=1440133 RepID=A0A9P6M883_9FUNG|nr:hypothetical protein BGZ65_008576 [Modicella reniformis]
MIVQDDNTSKQDTLRSDDDVPDELITAPSTTLVAPAVINSLELMENLQPQHVHQQADGHEDVDNEQPFGWVVVAAAFFVQAMVIGTVNGYGVYQDRYITHEYNTSSTFELSWIGTLNVVGMDMTGPLTGQIADYLGYRTSTFIGAVIMGVSLIATSFSTQVWQLYIFQGILYGLGASLAFFPSLSLPSQWFKRRRGLATGIAVAGGGFGGLVISPATTAMFGTIGYRWTVRTIALVHLAVIIPASFLFKARVESGKDRAKRWKREQRDREQAIFGQEKHNVDTSQSNPSLTTLGPKKTRIDFSALKERRFLILVCLSFFVAMGYFNPYYYFPTYVQIHGASVSTASLLVGILNGSSAIGRVSMGLASDYIGDINTLLISSFCACLSVIVVWMLAGSSVPEVSSLLFPRWQRTFVVLAVLPVLLESCMVASL